MTTENFCIQLKRLSTLHVKSEFLFYNTKMLFANFPPSLLPNHDENMLHGTFIGIYHIV